MSVVERCFASTSTCRSWSRAALGVAGMLAVMLGCASTQLERGSDHPASPAAEPAPLPAMGQALAADFEPRSAEPARDHAGHDAHASHGHEAARSEPSHAEASQSQPAQSQPAQSQPSEGDGRWTCPMHPEIVRAEPGKCPICGMKLKPIEPEVSPKESR